MPNDLHDGSQRSLDRPNPTLDDHVPGTRVVVGEQARSGEPSGRGPDRKKDDEGKENPDKQSPDKQDQDKQGQDEAEPSQGKEGDQSGDGDDKQDGDKDGKKRSALGWVRQHPIAVLVILVLLVAAIVATVLWWLHARHYESTDDAFVDGRYYTVAPRVTGYVTDVPVSDNWHVKAGAVLARIDPRDYEAALASTEAQVQSAQANIANIDAQVVGQKTQIERNQATVQQQQAALQFAQQDADRYNKLAQTGNGTVQQAQQSQSNLRQAQANLSASEASVDQAKQQVQALQAQRKSATANLAQAAAERETAKLNLGYATITAAQDGRIVRLQGSKGQYVTAGTALMVLVPDDLWVTANFKETQLADMRTGQPVSMRIDAYPGRKFYGHVDSVQAGSGTVYSLLPAENATGNYVKVVQRVPTKLVFDHLPDDVSIGPGMSVVPRVRVR